MTGGGAGSGGGAAGDGGGGTFCRFTVGRVGTAAAHLRYISRESAVLEREKGVLLHHVPEAVWSGSASTYAALRDSLIAYAWGREAAEGKRGRTHYRLLVSCEHEIATARLHGLLVAWLEEAVPGARAMGFVHRDTAHAHAHLFVEARGVDGRQLDFSARAWRQLDEVWNRIYARALGRDEQEHLVRKKETAAYKQARRRQQSREPGQHKPAPDIPARAAHPLPPAAYRERDRRAAGALNTDDEQRHEQEQEKHGRDTTRVGGDQRAAAARAAPAHGAKRAPSPAEPAARSFPASRERVSSISERADAAAERALSETRRLREDLARVSGEQQRATAAAEAVPAREARQSVERQVERDEGDELEKGR